MPSGQQYKEPNDEIMKVLDDAYDKGIEHCIEIVRNEPGFQNGHEWRILESLTSKMKSLKSDKT